MKKNIAGFSIVLAMWIALLITLLAFLILEYIIPFWRNVKGIENSSRAYYQAESGIEQALYDLSQEATGYSTDIFNTEVVSYNYSIAGNDTLLPPAWEGNSWYDSDWNIIAPGQPIQLKIWNGKLNKTASSISNISLNIRVPDIDQSSGTSESLSWSLIPIVNWQISSTDELLSATGSWITAADIASAWNGTSTIELLGRAWKTLEQGNGSITDFYLSRNWFSTLRWCNSTALVDPEDCTLKLSIVNPLMMHSSIGWYPPNTQVPYLEWKLEFENSIPLRYAGLNSQWTSYGFQKRLNVSIPQQTIVEAFDFTVFQ